MAAFPKPTPRAPLRPGQRRRRYIRQRRATPRRSGRVVDRAHLDAVRSLPCCGVHVYRTPDGALVQLFHHAGKSDPHHTISRGAGGSDLAVIPLARQCHRDVETLQGAYKDWTKAQRAAWYAEKVRETQQLLLAVAPARALNGEGDGRPGNSDGPDENTTAGDLSVPW